MIPKIAKEKRNERATDGFLAKCTLLFGEMTESIKKPHCLDWLDESKIHSDGQNYSYNFV